MIRLSQPVFLGNETAYVNDALDRGQLSAGEYVARFEDAFAARCGVAHAVACASGTAALHLGGSLLLTVAGLRSATFLIASRA